MTTDVRFDPGLLPELVGSAFDAIEEHRFRAHGREDRRVSEGVELELLRAIFGRIAAWFAAGAEPCVIHIKQSRLREFVPELLDAESELSQSLLKAKQKRFTDLAYAWNAAFEHGVPFLAARADEPPNYTVRVWVRNGGGLLRFWLDVERRNEDEAVVPVLTAARTRTKPLAKVLHETSDAPPFGRYWQAIKDAADRGHPQARSIIEDAKHYAVKTLKVVLWAAILGGVTYLLLPEPAQAAVRRFAQSVVELVKKAVPLPSDEAPSPPPQQRPQSPGSSSIRGAQPERRELPPIHVAIVPPDLPVLPTPVPETFDIYAHALAHDEQNVHFTVSPTLAPLGSVEASVKFFFGDGSSGSAVVRAPTHPSHRPAARIAHSYAQGDRLYEVRAEVRALLPEGGTRLVEIIERDIYVFERKAAGERLLYETPVPAHPFNTGFSYTEPGDPDEIQYVITSRSGGSAGASQ